MSKYAGLIIKAGLAFSLAAATIGVSAAPSQAQNAGAFVAGAIGGAALGAIVAGAAAAPPPPPPIYVAAPPPPPPGPHCWREPQQVWNGYAYVVRPVRVCD